MSINVSGKMEDKLVDKLVGVPEELRKWVGSELGASVWIHSHGRGGTIDELEQALSAAGIGPTGVGLDRYSLPALPEVVTRIRRAIERAEVTSGVKATTGNGVEAVGRGGKKRRARGMVKKAAGGEIVAGQIGEVLGESGSGGVDVEFSGTLSVKWDTELHRLVVLPLSSPLRSHILRAFEESGRELSSEDLARWMLGVLRRLGAVLLREKGGVYFLPGGGLEAWERLCAVMEQFDFRVTVMHAAPTSATVKAVILGVRDQARRVIKDVMASMENGTGERGLATAVRDIDECGRLVKGYEKLLGAGLEEITKVLELVRMKALEAKALAREAKGTR